MQYIWKLFKWTNGIMDTELTNDLVAPIFLEARCNGQLSSGEVVLETKNQPNPYPPKTKMTIQRWVDGLLNREWDYLVDHDDVEIYTGLPGRNCHRIHLIEPSAYAQGVHCDNFALTYELNDVTLSYKTVISDDEKAVVSGRKNIIGSGHQRPSWSYGGEQFAPLRVGKAWYDFAKTSTHYYTNSFSYKWAGLDALDNFNLNLSALVSHPISFTMPIMECSWFNQSAVPTPLFNCPTRCKVTRTKLLNGLPVPGTATTIVNKLYSPSSVQTPTGDDLIRVMYNADGKAGLCGTLIGTYSDQVRGEAVPGGDSVAYQAKVFRESQVTRLPAMINTNNTTSSSRVVSFNTTTLTEGELAGGYSYEYEISLEIEPYESDAIVSQYTARASLVYRPAPWWDIFGVTVSYLDFTYSYDSSMVRPPPTTTTTTVSFLCRNMLVDLPVELQPPFLLKGRKYNCFDLFRKAMLTTDTQVINNAVVGLDEKLDENGQDIGIQYPVVVDSQWESALKQTTMFESIFQEKNLWEIAIQLGYYIHAVPYLEFDRLNKDRFVLKFRQLGGTETNSNENTKLTIFNSQTLENFFTQYDAYVTNLFSPQNEIEEWLVCKTSDLSYLVSNETAELHTKYNITELVEFDITYNGQTKSALEFVFEKTVYDTLSAKTSFVPAKFKALYFEMGSNKILGLNYVPPVGTGFEHMSLQAIVGHLFNPDQSPDGALKFNDLRFHVKYKTQDEVRITQVRPDLNRFMKNSQYEKYPHHEQFYGQQDKIIDSERFSANLWGKLIRVANGIYQCQEYSKLGQEKEPGQLVEIQGEPFYVTECENEYYPDAIYQKVTYSKNFNQLSNIVTIPSEPRFYEVSERSLIRREVRLLEFIEISTKAPEAVSSPRFINATKWAGFIRDLLFAYNGNPQLPNFAYINFKADQWREHYNLPNQDKSVMYPSGTVQSVGNATQPAPSEANKAVIVPVLHFPLRNSLIIEWDMEDNFKAGDSIDTTTAGGTGNKAYQALQPVRYCDVYGRADLFDFKLFYKDNWTDAQLRRLPFADDSDYKPADADSLVLIPSTLSVGLDKDNREALSFNYQLSLLHSPNGNDSEDFIVFPNLFGKKNGKLKVVLLNYKLSMFAGGAEINSTTTVADNVSYSINDSIKIDFTEPTGVDLTTVESIVFYDEENGTKYAHLAKNVAKLPNNKKLQSWYIYPVYSD